MTPSSIMPPEFNQPNTDSVPREDYDYLLSKFQEMSNNANLLLDMVKNQNKLINELSLQLSEKLVVSKELDQRLKDLGPSFPSLKREMGQFTELILSRYVDVIEDIKISGAIIIDGFHSEVSPDIQISSALKGF